MNMIDIRINAVRGGLRSISGHVVSRRKWELFRTEQTNQFQNAAGDQKSSAVLAAPTIAL
jgi:mevalonate pyrophosphate decarboxylase